MQLRKSDFLIALRGSIMAAAVAAVALAILTPLDDTGSASVLLGSLFVYIPFCLTGELLIGLPMFLVLQKMHMVRWWVWLPLSLVLGIALGVLVGGNPNRDARTFTATLSVAIISAVVFRLALVKSKEDRISPAKDTE
jgi:uncharacterized membrane protein HdeD (DUF308 family)